MARLTIQVRDDTGKAIAFAGITFWNQTQDGNTCPDSWPSDSMVTDGYGKATFYNLNIGDLVHYKADPVSGYNPDRCHSHEMWKEDDDTHITLYKTLALPKPTILDYDFSPTDVKYLGSVDVSINIRNDGGSGDVYAYIYNRDTGTELASMVSYITSGQTKWLYTAFVNFKKSGTINCELVVGSEERYFSVNVIEEKCVPEDFVLLNDMIYETGGVSTALNQYSAQQGKSYRLTISKSVIDATDTGQTTKPGERTFTDIIEGWQIGIELQRYYCEISGTWYWVKKTAVLEDITPAIGECTLGLFTRSEDVIYETGGTSETLNQLSINNEKKYRLTVLKNAIAVRDTKSSEQPPERSFADIVDGWQTNVEETREFCQETGTWYWVTWTAILKDITIPTPPAKCSTDAECPSGQECVKGICEPIEKDNTALYIGAGVASLVFIYVLTKPKK